MDPNTSSLSIRSAENLEEAKALWWPLMKELGWNRAEEDAATHYSVAEDGKNWLVILPEGSDTPQGMVIPFIYPNDTAWVGFFIMNATFRGHGLGRKLWKEMELAFEKAGTTSVGLDGVEEQVETYKRRGFEDCARIPLMTRDSLGQKAIDVTWLETDAVALLNLRDVHAEQLAELDLAHTGLDRSAYWSTGALTSRIDSLGYAVVADKVVSFVYARRCEHGVRIGPLYAATHSQARQLLHRVMIDFAKPQDTFIAEVFGTNPNGRKVFEELGWDYAGLSYHRMWLKGKVPSEQQEGGRGTSGMFAILDACAG
ncbi:acyl-CoA N-acyltransferase [Paraphoma chrysanthemicola]|nr:acyl-CoA N-acyltransferase [Paraphoma chrysanthemicola]